MLRQDIKMHIHTQAHKHMQTDTNKKYQHITHVVYITVNNQPCPACWVKLYIINEVNMTPPGIGTSALDVVTCNECPIK